MAKWAGEVIHVWGFVRKEEPEELLNGSGKDLHFPVRRASTRKLSSGSLGTVSAFPPGVHCQAFKRRPQAKCSLHYLIT